MLSQGMGELVDAMILVLQWGKQMNYDLKSVFQMSKINEDNVVAQNLVNRKGLLTISRTTNIGLNIIGFDRRFNQTK